MGVIEVVQDAETVAKVLYQVLFFTGLRVLSH